MISLFAWSPPVPRWLAGILLLGLLGLLGLLAAAVFLSTASDPAG